MGLNQLLIEHVWKWHQIEIEGSITTLDSVEGGTGGCRKNRQKQLPFPVSFGEGAFLGQLWIQPNAS